jgi:hypothetical protein
MPSYIAPILIAIASCLAFVAYNHHDAFRFISKIILLCTMIIWLLWLSFQIGYNTGFSKGSFSFYDLNKDLIIKIPKFPESDYPSFLVFISPFALVIYLAILEFLPSLGIVAKPTEKKKE